MNIKLRKANIEDLHLIEYWDTKPHVQFATGYEEDDEDDNWMEEQLTTSSKYVEIFMAELDSRPIGIIQICDPANEETHYWGDIEQGYRALDIWIGEENDLGKGYGTIMMELAIEHCFVDQSVKAILIDPLETNLKAINFYKKCGFEFLEKRSFEDDDCDIYILTREKFFDIKKKP